MKKIGEIKGVPVVEGNINEVTKNQIHYKEDSGSIQLSKRGNDNKLNSVTGSSSGGGSKIGVYYKLNKKGVGVDSGNDTFYAQFKQENPDGSINIINKTSAHSSIIAVAMYPFGNKDLFIHSLEEYFTLEIKYENPNITDEELNNILKDELFSRFTPITEEEFYNLD